MKMTGRLEMDSLSAILKRRGLETRGAVQRYIDSEVIRYCDPYVPFLTGALKNSARLHTVIGSGLVVYATPYARRQYYTNKGNGKRGRLWFERMKNDHKGAILRGAMKIAGGNT